MIGRSPLFEGQFDLGDLLVMRRGLALVANDNEQVGSRVKYEIHHVQKIDDGGDVYDVDNVRILSPRYHIEAHK